jgi:hypothetical protein
VICVVTPYDRNEVTAAALRLADWVVSDGNDVRLVTAGKREDGIHPAWDQKVERWPPAALDGVTHVVYFHPDPVYLRLLRCLAKKARHVLVPGRRCGPADLAAYDAAVCPSLACYKALGEADNAVWCRWDAGLAPVRREGTVGDGRLSACFWCDHTSIDRHGPLVVHLVGEAMDANPKLDVTVLSAKSWADRSQAGWSALAKAYPGRLARRGAGVSWPLAREFRGHDWVVLPAPRAAFGLFATLALTCGTPVVANDVAPTAEIVSHGVNGLLVPGRPDGDCRSAVTPDASAWKSALASALGSNELLHEVQTEDWPLHNVSDRFAATWAAVLD